jgi:hypothetical protein
MTRHFSSRFWEMIRWEMRLFLGRRRATWWLTLGIFGFAILGIALWAASQQQDWNNQGYGPVVQTHNWAVVLLLSTPFRDHVLNIGQAGFGYIALRIILYFLIGFSKLVLPALAAGSIGNDRLTGRLEELRTTPLSMSSIFLAKAMAVMAPFLLWGVMLTAPFLLIAINESMPLVELMRLWLEFIGQIALIALISLMCSAVFRSPWTARVAAYPIVWLLLPAGWGLILHHFGWWSIRISRWEWEELTYNVSFAQLCTMQLELTVALCLFAFYIGGNKMQLGGFWAGVGTQMRGLFRGIRRRNEA